VFRTPWSPGSWCPHPRSRPERVPGGSAPDLSRESATAPNHLRLTGLAN
jgi:hypothetical protein